MYIYSIACNYRMRSFCYTKGNPDRSGLPWLTKHVPDLYLERLLPISKASKTTPTSTATSAASNHHTLNG